MKFNETSKMKYGIEMDSDSFRLVAMTSYVKTRTGCSVVLGRYSHRLSQKFVLPPEQKMHDYNSIDGSTVFFGDNG